jgi:hypothetical protein
MIKAKTNLLIPSLVTVGMLLHVQAKAAIIDFIEGAEGTDISVVDVNWAAPGVPTGAPSSSTTGLESATFTGYQILNAGSGTYLIGLYESQGGPLSDYLLVHWSSGLIGGAFLAQFQFEFKSDIEGEVLQPPPGLVFNATVIENGQLQRFVIPGNFDVSVGLQSDIETATAPETGSTSALLGFGLTGILVMKRSKNGSAFSGS